MLDATLCVGGESALSGLTEAGGSVGLEPARSVRRGEEGWGRAAFLHGLSGIGPERDPIPPGDSALKM